MKKKHMLCTAVAFILLLVTFYTDTKIFTNDPLNMNCLPIDTRMVVLMRFLTKTGVFLFFLLMAELFCFVINRQKKLLFVFCVFAAIYGVGLMVTYPGYFMSDDPIIFGYATRYYPVYWHHYLTSLFYMIGMSIFPASCGPVLFSDVCYALVYTYIFYEADRLYTTKAKYLVLFLGVLPMTLLGALMCFRPALYAPFFVFYFAFLFFEYKKKANVSCPKLAMFFLLTAVLCQWRSEGLVLIVFAPILLMIVYRQNPFAGSKRRKRFVKLFLMVAAFFVIFTVIKLPQSLGEKTYYGKDYLIISTTRPLSVIVHREQTYEGAEEDLANISAVTEFGYLHNDSLSCSAYNRYNTDHNEGKYTETGTDTETQNAYIKSAIRLILNNFDLYLGERLQLFLVTNGIFDYNKEMVLNLKPVVATDFHLYKHDKDYGFELLDAYKRIPHTGGEEYAKFLFVYGGEAYIPCLILAAVLLVMTFIKKKWFAFVTLLSLMAREAVIFLLAPASFIQYSYPMMFVTMLLAILCFVEWQQKRHRRHLQVLEEKREKVLGERKER